MIKINNNNAKTMDYEKLSEFSKQFLNWSDENAEIKAKISPMLVDLLMPANKKLDICIANIRGSKHTAALAGTDKRRDNLWVGIGYSIRTNLLHPLEEFRVSAERIARLLNSNKNLNRQEYDKQTGSIRSIIKEFRSEEYKNDVEKLGLGYYIDDLEKANNEFAKLMDTRVTQEATKVTFNVAQVRREIGNVLNSITNYLNGLVLIEGEAKYETAFRKLNSLIAQYGGDSTKYDFDIDKILEGTEDSAEDKYPNAHEWTNMVDVDDFKLGDICFMIIDGEKKYYEMIEESHFDLKPNGEEGYLGWKPLG